MRTKRFHISRHAYRAGLVCFATLVLKRLFVLRSMPFKSFSRGARTFVLKAQKVAELAAK